MRKLHIISESATTSAIFDINSAPLDARIAQVSLTTEPSLIPACERRCHHGSHGSGSPSVHVTARALMSDALSELLRELASSFWCSSCSCWSAEASRGWHSDCGLRQPASASLLVRYCSLLATTFGQ
jgi:hypothetical protein